MCDLCSNNAEEKALAVRASMLGAERLDRLAQYYRDMATGHIKPHSEQTKNVGILARSVVRELVEEWV